MKGNESYRQYVPTGELSLERNTGKVPNDDWFYVLQDDVVVGRFKSFKEAQQDYITRRSTLALPSVASKDSTTLSNTLDQYFLDKELYWAESHKFRRGGGKGGRGGI